MPLNYGLPNRPTHPRPRPIHLLNFLPRNYLVGLQIFRLRLPGRRTHAHGHSFRHQKRGLSKLRRDARARTGGGGGGGGEGKEIGRADNAGPISRSRSLHFDRQHSSIPHALALQQPRSLHFWMIPFRLSLIPGSLFYFRSSARYACMCTTSSFSYSLPPRSTVALEISSYVLIVPWAFAELGQGAPERDLQP